MYDIYPVKAQYLTDEEVDIAIETKSLQDKEVTLKVFHLEDCILTQNVVLDTSGQSHTTYVRIGSYRAQVSGFGVQLWKKEKLLCSTAFDVVTYPSKSLRYGFLSDFTKEDGKSEEDISNLRKFHINMVQFYDWSYRHDDLVSEEENYTDMMGKNISMETVKEKIAAAKRYGMKTMAYGAVYAASGDFYEKHPDWAFYTSAGEVFRFIDIFYIMNITKKCPWHGHIVSQYRKAVEEVGFSGIHMDTYGFPKTAYSRYNGTQELIHLKNEFASLINSAKKSLNEVEKDNYLVFNNVGNWPVDTIAEADLQAIYVEVWSPYERYFHIKQIIQEAQNVNTNDLPIILAAYLAPFRLDSQERAGFSAYILMAAIVSNGAYHLLLGEENAVLTQGYYSDYSYLTSEQSHKMRHYYDFMIRYMELFYDRSLEDVTMTHIGWDNYEYRCGFANWSSYAEADKIWITVRENAKYKTISLINLCGCKEDYWNQGKEEPELQKELMFTVHVDGEVKGIFAASPDREDASMYPVPYRYRTNEKGKFVEFTVASLAVWEFVVIRL